MPPKKTSTAAPKEAKKQSAPQHASYLGEFARRRLATMLARGHIFHGRHLLTHHSYDPRSCYQRTCRQPFAVFAELATPSVACFGGARPVLRLITAHDTRRVNGIETHANVSSHIQLKERNGSS